MGATLAQLRDLARGYADQAGSEFRSDADCNTRINIAWAELYDLLVSLHDDYFEASKDVTVVSGDGSYDISVFSPKVKKLRGVSFVRSSAEADESVLQAFQWSERGNYAVSTLAGTLRVFYIPQRPELVASGAVAPQITSLPDQIEPGWEDYIARSAAASLLMDEQNPDAALHLSVKDDLRRRITEDAAPRDADAPREIIRRRDPEDDYHPGETTRYCLRGLTLYLRSDT